MKWAYDVTSYTAVSGGLPSRRRSVEGRYQRKFGGSEGIAKQSQSIPLSVFHSGNKYRLDFVLPETTTNFNLDRPKGGQFSLDTFFVGQRKYLPRKGTPAARP